MTLLHAVPAYSRINEEYIFLHLRSLMRQGYDCRLVTSRLLDTPDRELPGLEVHVVPGRESGGWAQTLTRIESKLLRQYREFEVATTAIAQPTRGVAAVQAQFGMSATNFLRARVPVITSMHGYDGNVALHQHREFRRAMEKLSAGSERIFTFPSQHFANQVATTLKLAPSQVRVVRNYVNQNFFPWRPRQYDGGPLRLACIGRFEGFKDQATLLEAVRLLRDKGVDVTLDLVGFGPTEARLQSFIGVHSLADRVTLHAGLSRDGIRTLLYNSHVYVQPSHVDPQTGAEESFCIAIMEALASGLPVISSDYGALAEIYGPMAQADSNGFRFFEAGDAEALATVISASREHYQSPDEQSVQRFIGGFSEEAVGQRWADILDSLGVVPDSAASPSPLPDAAS
ncbi:glycosyltransferase family 4 protein [Marinobacter bohaiensis]|uniref:glycosyltransferase family 4 protein n=1 Tax=Marinobacter bohaiensis TaxID=2201898 RepID=UPI000DAD75CE|nr:glycosyltransferase family 4 protein [Marinobacter bohaiensis]